MRTLLPLLTLSLAAGCTAPDYARMFNSVEVLLHDDAADANAVYLDAIQTAEKSVYVAMPIGDDVELADALIDAYASGVDVEVVTDIDVRNDPAIDALRDADIPVTLADGEIAYFDFNLNSEVKFDSSVCVMSHSWVVADGARIVSGNRMGGIDAGAHITLAIEGEELVEDILWEHNQVFGGVDATAVTAFDANAKSTTDPRWGYMTDQPLLLGVWFGPQERLLKRVIDGIYGARVNIRIVTDTLDNPEIIKAVQDKAFWGIDVEVVVGSSFDPNDARLRDPFDAAVDVRWYRTTSTEPLPTVVIIDTEPDDVGKWSTVRGMVLTHGLLSASRVYRAEPIPSDQLIDGTLWTIEQTQEPDPELLLLLDAYQAERDEAEEL